MRSTLTAHSGDGGISGMGVVGIAGGTGVPMYEGRGCARQGVVDRGHTAAPSSDAATVRINLRKTLASKVQGSRVY